MAEPIKSKFSPFWIIVILLLLVLGMLVIFGDVLTNSERVSPEPVPPSTEWTTAPEGGLEVDLPDTPLRTVEPDSEVPDETPPEPEE